MKRILMMAVILMMASSAAQAQSQGYICLFVDDARTSYCAAPAGPPLILTMQIWCLPRFDGTYCAEFMIDYPDDPTVIAATVTYETSPPVSIILGDITSGATICYLQCQNTWFRPARQLIICQNANKNIISVVESPIAHGMYFNECAGTRPKYSVVAWNNLYLNYVDGVDPECGFTAVEEKTWGAIKWMLYE